MGDIMAKIEHTIKWTKDEIWQILERKAGIEIESLSLSHHGAKAKIKPQGERK